MVIHILKNGIKTTDITGHVVRKEDAPQAYALIERLNREREEKDDRQI